MIRPVSRLMIGSMLAVALGCGDSEPGDPDAGTVDATSAPDAPGSCEGPDFRYAPPPSLTYLNRVFVDVVSLDAAITFDAATEVASARSTMGFKMGEVAGSPVFDLRQAIDYGRVNDTELTEFEMHYHDFSTGITGGWRVAEIELEACSDNQLYLEYELENPSPGSSTGAPPSWNDGAITWGFKLYDVFTACLLEQWFPASLPYDYFDFDLEIEMVNTSVDHTVMTNGELIELGANHWQVRFRDMTSMSPFLEIAPSDDLLLARTTVELPTDQSIDLLVYQHTAADADLLQVLTNFEETMIEFATKDGPYPHQGRFIAYIQPPLGFVSEEYDGATHCGANPIIMRHELYHSWYGRGVKPARFNDAWFDEGWVMHVTDPPFFVLEPDHEPVLLSPENPWYRETPTEAYSFGAAMFGSLAELLGKDVLRGLMRDFVQSHPLELITTEDLEKHLYCESQEPEVRFWFHRFVYGQEGDPPAPPADYCD